MRDQPFSVVPIATIRKSDTEELRITVERPRLGKCRVKLREWFRSGEGMRPGREGLTIRPELLRPILEALRAIEADVGGERGAT